MANDIKLKRSATQGKVPTTAQLQLGELALNTHDGKLFLKKNDGTESIVEVGATDLGITTTTTSNTITSSTGDNATISEATSSAAGLMSTAHHDKLDGIEAGAQANAVTSVNGFTGTVVLGAGDVGAATTAQGALADTAVQSAGDTMTGALGMPVGSAASPSVYFDANTGLYSPGADQVAISTNGTGRLFVDATGRVGLGTTTPQSELTVRGSNPQITLEPTNDTTQNCRIEFALADGTVQSRITGGGSDGSAIRFSQGPTERARITSDGKLGLGTTNPGANLHINGNSNTELRIEDQGEYVSLLYNDNGSTLSVGVLNADNGNTSVADTELRIGVDGANRYVTKADGSHTFYQANGSTESMRISSAGAIGLSGANYGASGQVLTSNGSASAPTWQTLSSASAFTSYAIIEDQKGTGVDGGTFTSGSWQIRDLNTEVADPDGIVTLSSNEFTLGAGTYLIEWEAPAMRVNYHSTKLYDVTGASDAAYGTGEYSDNNVFVSNKSLGAHRVTLASSNTYRIEHRCNSTRADNGFGYTPSWSDGRFTKVKIWKE